MADQYEAEKAKYRKHFEASGKQGQDSASEELKTTPLFALKVKYLNTQPQDAIKDGRSIADADENVSTDIFPQYALLGLHIGDHPNISKDDPIMLNTATPNSTFICGSQGSGKSYTLSSMVENYLLPDDEYGPVANPVAGVAFHYDPEGSKTIAEVASLCSRGIKVRVLVSRGSHGERSAQYMKLAGTHAQNMDVRILSFKDEHINAERMKRLMAFSETAETGVPLYVSLINQTLREIYEAGNGFTFTNFENQLNGKKQTFAANQKSMLELRMGILKSFMYRAGDDVIGNVFKTDPGTLTVVDLTDSFMDQTTACMLFDICLELVRQERPGDGIAIVLDEAHRYMNDNSAATAFTDSLLAAVKLQRHDAARVIIATQEPTISPKLMDLCSITIVHRFSSPAWFNAIKDHLAAASDSDRQDMFEKIVKLNVGESLVFSPSSYLCLDSKARQKLGTGVMKMKTRGRKGVDIGKSKMAGSSKNDVLEGYLTGKVKQLNMRG